MNFIHEKLGHCTPLITFESTKNRLILVKAFKKYGKVMKSGFPWRHVDAVLDSELKGGRRSGRIVPYYWLLWGDINSEPAELGKTFMTSDKGNPTTYSSAMKTFMKASLTLDNLTFKKLV